MAMQTLKLTDNGKTFYPTNWSFLSLGNSRVYDELKDFTNTDTLSKFNSENTTHKYRIEDETERLEALGIKVEVLSLEDAKQEIMDAMNSANNANTKEVSNL